jgi:Fe-S-cluster containining protein
MPQFNDSVGKIISSYFSVVNTEAFKFDKINWQVKPLKISPLLLRDTICPENCGACCSKFSLDWIPTEPRPDHPDMKERYIKFNDKDYLVYTIYPENKPSISKYHCMFVNSIGRCEIHGAHPFSCDFELIRPMHYKDRNLLLTKLYGRCWNLLKVNNIRGGLCKITEINESGKTETKRKLLRLQQWCNYFELPTKIDQIIDWIQSEQNTQPITL